MSTILYPLFFLMCLVISGCCMSTECRLNRGLEQFTGGGEDVIVADLPFGPRFRTVCTQGAAGSTSHQATSTFFDVDLDTPNDDDVEVYAPLSGLVYIHDSGTSGFGRHVNLDLGDGTYIILGHLSAFTVENGAWVTKGQLIGLEGTTGASTGDHVHLGRHAGDPSLPGIYGESIMGLQLAATDLMTMEAGPHSPSEMTCGLTTGHIYESRLDVPLWHPDGTLVKQPAHDTVYLVDDGELAAFGTESSFLTRGYNFADVAPIGREEKACYGTTSTILDDSPAGPAGDPAFRDGALVSKIGESAVYQMSDGVAMPIVDWDTYLLMGYESRQIYEVTADAFSNGVRTVGDCSADVFCLTAQDVFTCGGPNEIWTPPTWSPTTTTSDTTDSGTTETPGLLVSWTHNTGPYEEVILSGAATRRGVSEEWHELRRLGGMTGGIADAVPDMESGDTFRFSVEYMVNGETNWSCVGPFPPGQLTGLITATYNGSLLQPSAADDPTSEGCGVQVRIP